jgi:hypothetical protein
MLLFSIRGTTGTEDDPVHVSHTTPILFDRLYYAVQRASQPDCIGHLPDNIFRQ